MVKVGTETNLFGDEPVFLLTRVVKPASPNWKGPRYVPNQKPTQQQMPAVNKRTLLGIPAQAQTPKV